MRLANEGFGVCGGVCFVLHFHLPCLGSNVDLGIVKHVKNNLFESDLFSALFFYFNPHPHTKLPETNLKTIVERVLQKVWSRLMSEEASFGWCFRLYCGELGRLGGAGGGMVSDFWGARIGWRGVGGQPPCVWYVRRQSTRFGIVPRRKHFLVNF